MFSFTNGTAKNLFKTMRKKKKKQEKIVLLARSTFNDIENIISKALRNHEISHDNFTIIIS